MRRHEYQEKLKQWDEDRNAAEKIPMKVGDVLRTSHGEPVQTETTDRGNSMIRVGFGDMIYCPEKGWFPPGRIIMPTTRFGIVAFLDEKADEVIEVEITRIHRNGKSVEVKRLR